jgi:hypothetical protein
MMRKIAVAPHGSWLSAALALPPLSLVGEVLIEKTHHRPLGAATFATIAMVTWVFIELFNRRGLGLAPTSDDRGADPSVGLTRPRVRRWLWGLCLLANSLVFARALF